MNVADRIREFGTETYVVPARQRKQERFSIRVGDVVREMKLRNSTPAVCSALKTAEFLEANQLHLVDASGPPSGLSTTVVYTYEFVDSVNSHEAKADAWSRLRGALKDVFAELGGGETYIRTERNAFNSTKEGQ